MFVLIMCTGMLMGIAVFPCLVFVIPKMDELASKGSDNCTMQFLADNYGSSACLTVERLRTNENRLDLREYCDLQESV